MFLAPLSHVNLALTPSDCNVSLSHACNLALKTSACNGMDCMAWFINHQYQCTYNNNI